MKTLAEVIAELQAVETTELNAVVSAITTAVSDLEAIAGATTPESDPVATVTVTTVGGVSTELVPKV